MKRLIVWTGNLILLFLMITMPFNCSKQQEVIIDLEIPELICIDGQHLIEGQILGLDGIKAVSSNIQTHHVIIHYQSKVVNQEDIITKLLDFGFTVNGMSGDSIAHKRLPECCLKTI